MKTTERKLKSLRDTISRMGSILVAFSGGVDSTFLLRIARDMLNGKVLAVTASSPTYPRKELDAAKEIARKLGVRQRIIETHELEDESFRANPANRCYYCKKELFRKLKRIASSEGLSFVADGSNADDLLDHRPGRQAARELGIRSPLQEAGLGKAEIRALSKKLTLPTWDKPSYACLASRFPYGTGLTGEKLKKVCKGEEFLRSLGFRQVRLRDHGRVARIEVEPAALEAVLKPMVRKALVKKLKALGYTYVTVDLQGFRTGSMNEVLKPSERKTA